ncbi:hypothetical protein BK141_04380 [Paenibacillus sp. FSL R5-0765]|nr:hypothetical protein BK141_04380 [Paenibacillus sp. FSL R5-0765]
MCNPLLIYGFYDAGSLCMFITPNVDAYSISIENGRVNANLGKISLVRCNLWQIKKAVLYERVHFHPYQVQKKIDGQAPANYNRYK